jgi:microcin C transport system substrate-binding protein
MNINLFYGAYTRTESYFSNSDFAYYSGLPEGRELEILNQYRRMPEAVFTEEYRLPKTDGSGNNREGLRRALALLREAGWTVRDRRLVNAEGRRFEFRNPAARCDI